MATKVGYITYRLTFDPPERAEGPVGEPYEIVSASCDVYDDAPDDLEIFFYGYVVTKAGHRRDNGASAMRVIGGEDRRRLRDEVREAIVDRQKGLI